MEKAGYLVLQNGRVFKGRSVGAHKNAVSRLLFFTGMTGFGEVLTDPGYKGMMVVPSFPMFGARMMDEYGHPPQKPLLSALIVRDLQNESLLPDGPETLGRYLAEHDIPCLTDVDTRAVVKAIRTSGEMNAALVHDEPNVTETIRLLSEHIVWPEPECGDAVQADEQADGPRVVILDCGTRAELMRDLKRCGCKVTVMPADASAKDALAVHPDGVILSGGPGLPASCTSYIKTAYDIASSGVPMMGVGLGHLLLALAMGAQVNEMRCGHHGAALPVQDLRGNVFLTLQNHFHAVDDLTLPPHARVIHKNLNDGTCEGLEYLHIPAFSVQFYPETPRSYPCVSNVLWHFTDLIRGYHPCR